MLTPRTARHQLHLVTEPRRHIDELARIVRLALGGGVDWVQLRDKFASAATLYGHAARLLAEAGQQDKRFSINDRLDVALAIGADGVHLAAQSLPIRAATVVANGRLVLGRSVHRLEEARAAADLGADYVTFGHVFPTSTHPGLPPRGLDELAAIVSAVDIPVLAIGGITAENLETVLATGCAGVAVISAILSDPDPARAARALRLALDSSTYFPRVPFPERQTGADAGHHQPATV